MSSRAARVSTASGEAPGPITQDVGQLAVEQLLEQPRRVAGQAAGRQDVDVAVGRLLDAEDQVLVGGRRARRGSCEGLSVDVALGDDVGPAGVGAVRLEGEPEGAVLDAEHDRLGLGRRSPRG